jgi:hypothetical protein
MQHVCGAKIYWTWEPVNLVSGLENKFKVGLREMVCPDRKWVEVAVNWEGKRCRLAYYCSSSSSSSSSSSKWVVVATVAVIVVVVAAAAVVVIVIAVAIVVVVVVTVVVVIVVVVAVVVHECGSLSPRHGAASGCGWRNGLLY